MSTRSADTTRKDPSAFFICVYTTFGSHGCDADGATTTHAGGGAPVVAVTSHGAVPLQLIVDGAFKGGTGGGGGERGGGGDGLGGGEGLGGGGLGEGATHAVAPTFGTFPIEVQS